MDHEIISKITLTPAEKQVICEQGQSAVVSFEKFMEQTRVGDIRGLVETWADLTSCYEYMSNILNVKTNRALHAVMLERGENQ